METSNLATISIQDHSVATTLANRRGKLGTDRIHRFVATGRKRAGYHCPSFSRENVGDVVWLDRRGRRGKAGEVSDAGDEEERVRKIRKLDLVTPLPLISPNAHSRRIRSPSLSPASSTFTPSPFSPSTFPGSPSVAGIRSTKNATFDSNSSTPSRPHFSFLPYDQTDDVDHPSTSTTRIGTPVRAHFFSTTPSIAFSSSLRPIPDLVDGIIPSVQSSAGPTRTRPWQRPKPIPLPLKRSDTQSTLASSPSRHYSIAPPNISATRTAFRGIPFVSDSASLGSARRQGRRFDSSAGNQSIGRGDAESVGIETQVGRIKVEKRAGEELGFDAKSHSGSGTTQQRPQFFPTATAALTPTEILSLHYSNQRPCFSSTFPPVPTALTPALSISLVSTSVLPPITRASLKELDLAEILQNPALRHDVFHDEGLVFRANYDGERYVPSSLPRYDDLTNLPLFLAI